MKVKRSIIATNFFVIFLVVAHYIHMTYLKVDVVFFAAIGDAVIATIFASVLLFGLTYFKLLGNLEKAQLVVIWLLAGYGFAISIPTVIDRSLSFYILEKLQQRGGGIRLESMPDVFIKEYLPEHKLFEVRLTEQMESGTIVIRDGCVKLTPKGEKIAIFSKFYRQNFLPKHRLLLGQYSDDLTNPFRKSEQIVDYICN